LNCFASNSFVINNAIFLKSVLLHLDSISPSAELKKWSKEAMCRAIRFARSGETVYLRASKYFPVSRANSGEIREVYIPFSRGAIKCAFRKKNCSTQ